MRAVQSGEAVIVPLKAIVLALVLIGANLCLTVWWHNSRSVGTTYGGWLQRGAPRREHAPWAPGRQAAARTHPAAAMSCSPVGRLARQRRLHHLQLRRCRRR
jgi:hypothetical protein